MIKLFFLIPSHFFSHSVTLSLSLSLSLPLLLINRSGDNAATAATTDYAVGLSGRSAEGGSDALEWHRLPLGLHAVDERDLSMDDAYIPLRVLGRSRPSSLGMSTGRIRIGFLKIRIRIRIRTRTRTRIRIRNPNSNSSPTNFKNSYSNSNPTKNLKFEFKSKFKNLNPK